MTLNREILRFVDTIHRDRQIDKEVIFKGIELALLSAAQKKLGPEEEIDIDVAIDRETGEIRALADGEQLSPEDLGRIAALSGKQVLYQRIREAERDVVYQEYLPKIGALLNGTVQTKKPGGVLILALGKAEGFLPRSEQSSAETFNEGDRIKVVLKEVNMQPNRVQLLCSRAHEDLVRRLFELEIPEVSDYVVEIKAVAREAGHRTKIAVATYDSNVDCVGACVGVKGSRIRNIVDELFGEKIDIVRWNDSIEVLIVEALRPAEIASLDLDYDTRSAIVYVKPDHQSLAIGRRGQNVRLASKLTGWELNITPVSDEDLERMQAEGLENLAQGLFSEHMAQAEQEEAALQEVGPGSENPLDRLIEQAAEKAASEETEQETAVPASHDPFADAVQQQLEAEPSADTTRTLDDALAEARSAATAATVALEQVPGIDPELAERLRSMGCDSPSAILAIGEDSLVTLAGVEPQRARMIIEHLQRS